MYRRCIGHTQVSLSRNPYFFMGSHVVKAWLDATAGAIQHGAKRQSSAEGQATDSQIANITQQNPNIFPSTEQNISTVNLSESNPNNLCTADKGTTAEGKNSQLNCLSGINASIKSKAAQPLQVDHSTRPNNTLPGKSLINYVANFRHITYWHTSTKAC